MWRGWAPALETTAPGPVTGATLATLVAAARTVVERPIEPSHYAEYFRWRAEHLPGYRTLYERFTAQVDRDARRRAGSAFADCSAADRMRLLDAASRTRTPRTVRDVAWMAAGGCAWREYDRFIFDEALALFAGWAGTPATAPSIRSEPCTAVRTRLSPAAACSWDPRPSTRR